MNAKKLAALLAKSNEANTQRNQNAQEFNDSKIAFLTSKEAKTLGATAKNDGKFIENSRFTGSYGRKGYFIIDTDNGPRKLSCRKSITNDLVENTSDVIVHLVVLPPSEGYDNPLVTVQYAEHAES